MKLIRWTIWAVAIGCAYSGGLVTPAQALVVTFDRSALLGQPEAGRSGGGQSMHTIPGTGSTDGVRGTTSLPSGDRFDSWLDADLASEGDEVHTGVVTDGSYAYLVRRSGSATFVWRLAALDGRHNLLSSWDGAGDRLPNSFVRGLVANGTGATPIGADFREAGVEGVVVNDSGSTLALLGLSLGALSLVRRKSGNAHP